MPTKKQTKKLTPSKLLKTNGRFSLKKGALIAFTLAIVAGILVFTTFAGSYQTITTSNSTANGWSYYGSGSYGGYFRAPIGLSNYYEFTRNNHTTVVSSPSGQNVEFCITYKNMTYGKNTNFKMDIADINQVKYFALPSQRYGSNNLLKTCIRGTAPYGNYNSVSYRVFGLSGGDGILISQATVQWF